MATTQSSPVLKPQLGAYQACLEESLTQWPQLIKRWSEKLLEVLVQHALHQAAEQLRQHQDWISHRFVAALVQEIAQDQTQESEDIAAVENTGAGASAILSLDQLAAMNPEQLQETINLARLEQMAYGLSKAHLVAFTALFSSAQGLGMVSLARNPFRPEVVARVLLKLIQNIAVDATVRTQWCIYGAPVLGRELRVLYGLLIRLLLDQGVTPVHHSLTQRASKHLTEQFELAFHPQPKNLVLTLPLLHRLLTNGPSGAAQTTLTEPAVVGAYSELCPVALEAMRLLMQTLTCDERLLKPIRQALAGLGPALRQLTLEDWRFWRQQRHPARRLLHAMTHDSLAYSSMHSAGFAAFLHDVHQVNAALAHADSSDVQLISQLLQVFEERQHQRKAKSESAQDVAVNVLLQAEVRNLLARKLAIQIQERPDFLAGNRVITNFLTGPWAQVLAQEQLHQQQGKTDVDHETVFSITLTDLLWSINLERVAKHRRRLVKIVPGLLERLRAGLVSIHYPLEKSKPFFEVIMSLHQSALTPVGTQVAGATPAAVKPKATVASLDGIFDRGEPWLLPEEVRAVNLIQVATGRQHPVRPIGAFMPVATWIEFVQDGKVKRAQLSWISPHKFFLLFTGVAGQVHTTTQRTLQYLQTAGFLTVISQRSVLDDALDTLVHTAMRNSVEM